MAEIADDFDGRLRRAHDALRQEAEDCARSQEMLNGLLKQIYDEDEAARYDAAQILTMLPDPKGRSPLVRRTLATSLLWEQSPEIRAILAERLNEFVADEEDHLAFGALTARAESDESAAVRRWCLSGMGRVYPEFIPAAKQFLTTQRTLQPGYLADIDESLAMLEKRSPTMVTTTRKSRKLSIFRFIASFVIACAVVFMFLQHTKLRTSEGRINGLAAQLHLMERVAATRKFDNDNLALKTAELSKELAARSAPENLHKIGPARHQDAHWVAAAYHGEPLPPNDLIQLKHEEQLLGSHDTTWPIALLGPAGTYILSTHPELRWNQKVPGDCYRVSIQTSKRDSVASLLVTKSDSGAWVAKMYDENNLPMPDGCTVKSTSTASGTEWIVEPGVMLPLKWGQTYKWFVQQPTTPTAIADATTPSSKIAVFKVGDPEAVSDAALAGSVYGGNHLLLGAYYAAHGFIENARAELKRTPDKAASKLLKNLDSTP